MPSPSPRFNPARAGNTAPNSGARASCPVQPRACGEHSLSVNRIPRLVGSTPRVRGTLCHSAFWWTLTRFNPARAGNTLAGNTERGRQTVQPRACGEHLTTGPGAMSTHGSTPRVRGTPARSAVDSHPGRFNPARAGNTVPTRSNRGCSTVQPRACGEHQEAITHDRPVGGSTPRVRGTPWLDRPVGDTGRFNPARAGNTSRERRR